MKKTLKYAAIAALFATVMTGCKKDGESYSTFGVRSLTYVTDITDATAAPIIGESEFSFNFNYTTSGATVGVSEFESESGKDDFTTSTMPFSGVNLEMGGALYTANATDAGKTRNGETIDKISFTLSPMYLPPRDLWNLQYNVAEGSNLPRPDLTLNTIPNGLILNATLGNVTRLRTFWSDLTFVGKTNTSVGGNSTTAFESTDILYRVKMDIRNKKATVVMYNVQFNPHMPAMPVLILADLDLIFTSQGYIVEGQNKTPLYISGTTLVEKPDYPFTSFILNSTADLMGASITFSVASNFIGTFRGDCMVRINQ